MKNVTKKIYAIILIILMLLNYMPAIVSAADYDYYAVLELTSTESEYAIGDEVLVEVRASELHNTGNVKALAGLIVYDKTALQLVGIELTEAGYRDEGSIANNALSITTSLVDGTLEVGDVICIMKFTALKSSETSTVVKLLETDMTCNDNDPWYDEGTVNEPEITLPVVPDSIAHNLKITKTDAEGTVIENNSALFKIVDLNGETIYKETESDGSLTLSDLQMPTVAGPYVYTIQELIAPTGYVVNSEVLELTVTFADDGTVTAATLGTASANVVTDTNTIEVSISNKLEIAQEEFNLILNKVNEEGNSITTDTAEFTVSMPNGTKENIATNLSTGKTNAITVTAPDAAGTYAYVIDETKAPDGYILQENSIVLELTYEEQDNKIVLVNGNIVSYNNEAVTPTTESGVKTLTVDIKNELEVITYNYELNIEKVKNDTANTVITDNEAIFEITDSTQTVYVKTDASGKAVYAFSMTNKEIVAGTNYTYTIKEIKAPEGYVLDETEKTVTLTFKADGSIDTMNVSGSNITKVSSTTNAANVKIVNEEEIVIVPEEFNMVINKVDEEGNSIKTDTAEFVVTMPNGTKENVATNVSTGKTNAISVTAPETAGTYTYVIKETKAPAGYVLEENNIIVQLTYEEQDNKIVLVSGTTNGETLTPTTVSGVKTLSVDIENESETITYDYSLNIEKVKNDTFNTKITEDEAIFEITDGTKTTYIKTNTLGKATYEFSMTNKEIVAGTDYVYTIKEVKAPDGYVLDETPKTVTLTFKADGSIDTMNISGTNITKVTSTTNTASVKVVNEEIVIEEEPVIVPEDFELVINKVDEDENIITSDEAKFILVKPDGTTTNYTTTNGVVSGIELTAPSAAGKQVYFLKETKAPDGYKILNESLVIEMEFIEDAGKVVISKVVVKGNEEKTITPTTVSGTKTLTINVKNELEPITYDYKLNIEKVKNDTANTVITEDIAIFEITDGTKVTYITTDSLGKAVYEFSKTNEEIVVGDNYTYTIKEVKAPNGYVLDATAKTLILTFKADGSINTMNVSGSNITKVTSTTNTADVKIVNEEIVIEEETEIVPENFNLVINKVNEEGNSITTDTAEFIVTMPNGMKENVATNVTTGKTNAISVTAPEVAGTYTYVIKETKAPTGYVLEENNIIVQLTYEEQDNKIILVSGNVNGEALTPVTVSGEKTLTVDIENESETITYDYTLNIEKVKNDALNTKITEDEAIFEITDGTKTIYVKTNNLGKATYEFSMTNKEIVAGTDYVYTIKEIKAPEGYVLDETPKTVTLTFKADGNIDTMNVSGTNITKVTSTTNTASVKVVNEEIVIEEEPVIVPEDFELVINKVDEDENIITSDEAKFILVKPDGTTTNYTTTNGVVSGIELTAPSAAGKQVYFLKETKAPDGYKILNESLVIEMEFIEDAGKIVISKVVVKGNEEKTITPTTVSGTKTLTINVKNELEPITYDYKLNIEKVKNDTANTVITEDIAIFEITDGTKVTYITTDSLGKAAYEFSKTNEEIVVGTNYTYTIKEVKAPNGYVLDGTAKTVTLTFKADGSIDTMNVSGSNITKVTSTTNTADIKIVNEEVIPEVVLVPEEFNMIINKVDEEGNVITSDEAEFTLIKPDGTSENYTTTNGVVTGIQLTAPSVAGKQVYFLKETKAPEGYNILNESLVIEMEYVESTDKIVLVNAVIKEYGNQSVTPVISGGTKTLIINVRNEKVKEIGKYVVEVNVEDREGQPVTAGTMVLKLTNTATAESIYKELSVVNGKIEFDMPESQGTITYEIEQITAPEGYELNPNKITVKIDFENNADSELELEDYTVTGTDAKKGIATEQNTASVIIINDKTLIKENYSLEIDKLDAETNSLILEDSAVFTVISSNAKMQEYTTSNGKIVINNLVPGNDGEEVIYVIKEKEAPEEYELLEKSVVIKVGFAEEDGIVTASSTQVLLGTEIANAQMVGTTVKVNVLNEKEEIEDLYVISKKDENGIDIYNVMDFYTGRQYSIENPFIDTKVAKYGKICTVQEFINNLESNGTLTVWDGNGNKLSSDSRITTKMILKATKDEQELTFTIIIKGDCNGDGVARTNDADVLALHIARENLITDPIQARALDLVGEYGDGVIRTNDLQEYYDLIARR